MRSEIGLTIGYTARDYRLSALRRIRNPVLCEAVITFVLLLVIFTIASHFVVEDLPGYLRYMVLGTVIGIPLVRVGVVLFSLVKSARAAAKSEKIFTIVFKDENIEIESDLTQARLKWKAYDRLIESPEHFWIAKQNGGLSIPKRCFENEQKIHDFRIMATDRLGEHVLIRK
jgi:YcxB-like protein